MSNFEKPLHDFTEEELQQKINQWDPRFGALALYELQRRLQEKNTKQIATLVKEIKSLKDITDKNAKTTTQRLEVQIFRQRRQLQLPVYQCYFRYFFLYTKTYDVD